MSNNYLNFVSTFRGAHHRFTNGSIGVNTANYSNAFIRPCLFQNNDYGIYIDASSAPICGGSSSFRNNSWDIYSAGSNSIYALGNYWGICTPTPVVTDNVDYSNYIYSDPFLKIKNFDNQLIPADISYSVKTKFKNNINLLSNSEKFKAAQLFFIGGKYDEAISEAESIINSFDDGMIPKMALVLIEQCYEMEGKTKYIGIKFEELSARNKTFKPDEFINYRKALRLVNEGMYNEALKMFKLVLLGNPDSIIVKNSLFQTGDLLYSYCDDEKTGIEYFDKLIKNFPNDQLSKIAKIKMHIMSATNDNKQSIQAKKSSLIAIQNYPNPFNPSTIIEYRLNESGMVKIKIFDVIGREITTLVNENKISGIHKISFDGSRLSSGNYFYSIEFTPVDGKKEIIRKLMQLVK